MHITLSIGFGLVSCTSCEEDKDVIGNVDDDSHASSFIGAVG